MTKFENLMILAGTGALVLVSFLISQYPHSATATPVVLAALSETQVPNAAVSSDVPSLTYTLPAAGAAVRGCPADGSGCNGLPFGQIASTGRQILMASASSMWNCISGVAGQVSPIARN